MIRLPRACCLTAIDLIVAANVLHNAEDPAATLAQLRPLLTGGGVILLIEATRNTRAHAITFGLIEGLSSLTEEEDRPFLPLPRWIEALEAAGFREVETGSDPTDPATDVGVDVIVARAPRPSAAERGMAWQTARNNFTEAGLQAFLSQRRPTDMPPDDIVLLDAFPLSADGTIDLEALRAHQLADRSHAQPSSATETALTEIWSSALGRDVVGLRDNFLELGGDSLIAVRLLAGVGERFQFEAPLRLVFEYPTIFKMAAEIERRMREQDFVAISDAPSLPAIVADPANASEPFPLTKIQEAYWIGRSSGLELGNVGAHAYLELEAGPLDRERLEGAWQRVIERHGMLRTVVLADGRQQLLVPAPRYRIEKRDLAGFSENEARQVLAQERARMSHQVFSGERWPSFEIRAIQVAPDKTRLLLSFDLLMIDLWSLRLVMRDVLILYEQPAAELPPLEISFRDYVLAVAALEETEAWKRSLRYWTERLAELPPAPELPLARAPATVVRPRFTRRSDRLDANDWQKIKDRAKAEELTPSSVLLAAFADKLAAWSRRPQFTINLTLFQRLPLHAQVNQLVGDFTSTTLLSTDCASAQTFAEHARNLQAQLWRDLDHRYVSGVRVIRDLARMRESGLRPIMPVVFTSGLAQGMPELAALERLQGPGLGELIYGLSQTPQVWLDHQVYEQEGALQFNWDAVEELFPSGLLDDMFAAYRSYLRRLAHEEAAWTEASTPPRSIHAVLTICSGKRRVGRPAAWRGGRDHDYSAGAPTGG